MSAVHPSSAKVFEFVERLEAVVEKIGHTGCHMFKGDIMPECGTPACHGGWAGLALGLEVNGRVQFLDGADLLANHLGFSRYGLLMDWAVFNPDLWGNKCGGRMFADPKAFGMNCMQFPVSVLINHWRSVGERLRALEEAAK